MNEWNAQNAIWSLKFGISVIRNLISRVLTIHHVKLAHSVEQKRFDLPLLTPLLRNLWLLLVFLITNKGSQEFGEREGKIM